MRTLVISDLHLGARGGRPTLEDPGALASLAEAVGDADRLVLLGDVIELRELVPGDALAAASRVLPQVVAGMRPETEVLVLPGNHDHELLRPWLARRRATAQGEPPRLEPQTEVDWTGGEPLAEIAEMLASGGASVRAFYPGVWLRDDVYVHHGHYLDRHTTTPAFERVAAGLMGRLLKIGLSDMSGVDDYERVLAPIYAWMGAITETGGPEVDPSETGGSTRIWRRLNESRGLEAEVLKLGVRALTASIGATGIGPFSGNLSVSHVGRAALRAYGQVLAMLGVNAAYSIFGHTHRAGPLPLDERADWVTPAGTRLMNCGCWVKEGAFIGAGHRDSPYRAGFAVELQEAGPPRLVNLLTP